HLQLKPAFIAGYSPNIIGQPPHRTLESDGDNHSPHSVHFPNVTNGLQHSLTLLPDSVALTFTFYSSSIRHVLQPPFGMFCILFIHPRPARCVYGRRSTIPSSRAMGVVPFPSPIKRGVPWHNSYGPKIHLPI